ncbi:hypothetical protein M427DRAFT_113695 [Gonapodya prolifera JEL478]|uniref:25S rRNA adenine-N(1) methyltransferase n=1 Tax=Gonapodya prolifera (strain JEL478) TaxID=1344416 RepID=A0A139A809_GONPJ|nr:hypothetical protein M427DRAFT_113695 [Gonapodya prolifera JEL478]|eukprot:KXS12936.1 hypothetical protein M427DRAFT_113695 [Gonapodya prolifera JEL478]
MVPRPKAAKRRRTPITSQARPSSGVQGLESSLQDEKAGSPSGDPESLTSKSERLKGNRLIRRFHTLSKQLAQLRSQPQSPSTVNQIALIEEEIRSLGGIERYQRASLNGQKASKGGESTAKWFGEELREHFGQERSVNLLDVGCLRPSRHYLRPWIRLRAIDLNPTPMTSQPLAHSPNGPVVVEKADLLSMEWPKRADEKFHALGLSLVVNFVGDAEERGFMLSRSRLFLRPPSPSPPNVAKSLFSPTSTSPTSDSLPPSLICIVLPAPCVLNSRYLDAERLEQMMRHLGFTLDRWKVSRGKAGEKKGKGGSGLAYYIFSWRNWGSGWERLVAREDSVREKRLPAVKFPKKQLFPGPGKNNFTIVL